MRSTSQAPRTGRPFELGHYLVVIRPKIPQQNPPHSSLHPTQNLSETDFNLSDIDPEEREGIEGSQSSQMARNCLSLSNMLEQPPG